MAITNHQQPAAYTPAGNQQIFESTSNNIAITDFIYRVICTDISSAEAQTFNIKKRPTTNGEMIFDAKVFSNTFVEDYIPNNQYGWKECTDGLKQIRVNVGEYYSAAYSAGVNYDYYVWNASLRALEWASYNQTDFVYNSATNKVCLNELTANMGYADKSDFVYFMGSTTHPGVLIYTYDSGGNFIASSQIANATGAYYSCIDIGVKGLTNISAGDVTGTYPIITDQVSYYEVRNNSLSEELYKTITITSECKHEVYTLHYLAKNGNFETMHLPKVSEYTEEATKTYIGVNPNTLVSNTYSYSAFSEWEKCISSSGKEGYLLNTDWMSNTETAIHRGIYTSPKVYMDFGSTIGLIPCKVLDTKAFMNQGWNNKNYGHTLTVIPTFTNVYG